MARFRIEESVVDTSKATWSGSTEHRKGGYGHVWQEIHRSRRGRWYTVHMHSWCEDGRQIDYAEWISPEEAARLILANNIYVPNFPELKEAIENVSE